MSEKNFTGTPEPSTMQVRRMFFSTDGWPYVSPAIYADETWEDAAWEEVPGFYERIDFADAFPQVICTASSMQLHDCQGQARSYEHGSLIGSWKRIDGNMLRITCGPHIEEVRVGCIWDRERSCATVGLCGVNEKGTSFWAKKVPQD